ncbi:hypothetical protein [Sandaracinus amylolyticus]|uniref:Peptidase C-terminal archaeal/bacterial domain-containing protein n=1 Tax=Sandaracinus amylolyticus TaxID=927083 RepID=A0A0F6YI72_9BACT|nr:hypothetical protein [Sandaracinus amylolyticus]AKF05588.1 hypothetical protein DB32_002737 [Sandaracinus amylolyticus]
MKARSRAGTPIARLTAQISTILAIASCGGGSTQIDPRFVTVHNTMAAMGLVQSGEISQGSLSEGAETTIRMPMRAGDCYTVVALAQEGVRDLDVVVRDASGNELGRDRTQDPQAAAQVCPPYAGEFEVVVRMVRGSGTWIASAWSGGARPAGDFPGGEEPGAIVSRPPHGGPGTCEEPYPITAGTAARGDTTSGDSVITGTCLGGGNAPEHVYSFTLDQRSMVSAVMNSVFDGSLYLLGACGESRSEIACNDDAPSTSRSEIGATLEPGLYFLVVDGFGTAAGEYEVTLTTTAMQSVAEMCGGATTLSPGQPVAGTTAARADYFQGTCAGQTRSGDQVYAIDVAQRSRMRVRMQSTYDGALHVRRDCADASTEIACNDDFRDTRHSLITATVDPGRYYVFADGYATGATGDYSLMAELAPATGTGAASDTCASPGAHVAGQDLIADTFTAADDLAGSCGGQGAPDVVYRLDVRSRTRIRARFLDQEFAPVVYLQSACGTQTSELFCVDGSAGAPIDQTVQPGTYFLVVDGQNADAFGSAQISLQLDDLGALDQSCRSAPQIRPGRQITGDTTGSTDRFQATCAGNAQSPDLVYRLQLRRRQRVRISSEQTDFDGAIYVRSDCIDANTEVACNDDAGDNRHSMIEVVLDPGNYFVFVDGYATGNQGRFTLDVDLSAP